MSTLIRTQEDIRNLKGQEETIRLEFKSGKLFDDGKDIWSGISKEVSAFANTEGGVLVLGLPEEKIGKIKVAGDPDGVPNSLTKDDLQRRIEDNLRPYLPGIHYYRVPIESLPDRVVWVVEIPQGKTAYQASDCKYYGRSEVEAKPLRDDVIRLRMERGRVARARIEARLNSSLNHTVDYVLREHDPEAFELFKNNRSEAISRYTGLATLLGIEDRPDRISAQLYLVNDGELTVRAPLIRLSADLSLNDQLASKITLPTPLEMWNTELFDQAIYPDDEITIPRDIGFQCSGDQCFAAGAFVIVWKVFLDNAPSCSGRIDLGQKIQDYRDLNVWRHKLEDLGLLDSTDRN
jgi:hypothetical protein